MPTNVIMPQMGESIAEGTLTKWLKKPGDAVKRDEPLFEISTDKVDAEIPSPGAGTLLEILVPEGQTVPINTVVARLAEAGEATAPAPAPSAPPAGPAAGREEKDSSRGEEGATAAGMTAQSAAAPPQAPPPTVAAPPAQPAAAVPAPSQQSSSSAPSSSLTSSAPPQPGESHEELLKRRSSPVVRAIAEEKGVDISQIPGTGISGRVTKQDIEGYLANAGAPPPAAPGSPSKGVRASAAAAPPTLIATSSPALSQKSESPAPLAARPADAPVPARAAAPSPTALAFPGGSNITIEPMTAMRKKIAQRMVESKQTSAHVTTVFEIDYSGIAKLRNRVKGRFEEQYGTKLSFLPFILQATVAALKARPLVNASIVGDDIVHHREINLGIAVALDWGLIVPVIRRADDLSLVGLARAANDLAARARQEARSGRGRGRHLHRDEPRLVRLTLRDARHQPAAGRDHGRRGDREAAEGRRDARRLRLARDQDDGLHRPHVRPPDRRRRRGRRVRERREGGARERLLGRAGVPRLESSMPRLEVVTLLPEGPISWDAAFALQTKAAERVKAGGDESLFLLEHEDVITVGRNAGLGELLVSEDFLLQRGVQLRVTDRGGKLTFHGPGQLVAYPVLDLSHGRRDVRRYVRDLEEVLILTAADFGVAAGRSAAPDRWASVWVGNDKLAAIGVHLSRWVTTHGAALNVTTDLARFSLFIPCGIADGGVTSLSRERPGKAPPALREVAERFVSHFLKVFEREQGGTSK
jgi:pyruvate dehydrogenase E2 component (dihydrolipoamide acetyltransferase)